MALTVDELERGRWIAEKLLENQAPKDLGKL
jgi:hypothetical protein